MFDALALPGLAILVVGYVAYISIAWLSDKNGRALNVAADDEPEDSPSALD